MKKGWQTKNLGDLCEIVGGGTPAKDNPSFYSGEIPWATVRDMRNDDLTETEFRITNDAVKNSASNIIPAGNVIIATRVGLGKVCILGQDTAINQDLKGVIPLNTKSLNIRYLFWWFKSISNLIIKNGKGATVQGVTLPFIKSLQIPSPPLNEQHRIVAILDEAFENVLAAKANAEQNLKNARELFESYLQEVFTQRAEEWVDSTIGSVIKFIDYRGKTPEKTTSGVRLITAKNVKMGYLQDTPMEFIGAASYKSWMTRGIPNKGDVLFTTEAPLANVAQLDTDEKVAFAQRIIIMQPNGAKLDSTFLKYLLLSHSVQQRIRTKATGATVQGIKASLLKQIDISYPDQLGTQTEIVQKLDFLIEETKRLESIYKQKIAALDDLKKALLHQAFSGNL